MFESLPSSHSDGAAAGRRWIAHCFLFLLALLFVVASPPPSRLVPHIVHYGSSAPPGISSLTSVLLRCILTSALLPSSIHPLVSTLRTTPSVTLSDIPHFVPISRHSSLITRHMTFDVPHEPLATGPPNHPPESHGFHLTPTPDIPPPIKSKGTPE